MDKKIRIAMLISRFYPCQGGAEIQCRLLSQELLKINHEPFILTQKLTDLKSFDEIEGLSIYRIGLPLKNKLGSLSYLFSGFIWLWRNLANFDLLHAHLASSPAILTGITAKIFGKPTILKIGGSRKTGDVSTSSITWYGRLKLIFLRKTINAFICPSREIKQELINAGFADKKIYVIPNGINTEIFSPATTQQKRDLRLKLGLPQQSRIVIYTGRFERGKGLEILIESWPQLEQKLKNANSHLVILGSGSLDSHLKQKCKGINSITFPGRKDNVKEYLLASDIFVLPSFGEGLPNSLIEAMSCGLACIATDIGGINELISHNQNGILIKPGNTENLCAELEKLILSSEYAQVLGEKASLFVEQNLSIKKVTEQYLTLYKNVLQTYSYRRMVS